MAFLNSSFDQLLNIEGPVGDPSRELLDEMPLPGESPVDTSQRTIQEASRTAIIQARKGKELAAKGFAPYTDQRGNAQQVEDETGRPLTNYDNKNQIGYDSAGAPKTVSFDPVGTPVL